MTETLHNFRFPKHTNVDEQLAISQRGGLERRNLLLVTMEGGLVGDREFVRRWRRRRRLQIPGAGPGAQVLN